MAAGSKELFIIRVRKLLIEDEWYSEDFVEEMFQAYKDLVDNWYKIDKNINPFPYRALPKDLAGRLRKGYILDEGLRKGQIITHYKQLYPSQLSEYEAEGGYYAYPDGQNVYDKYN
ncbi:hypothetical protein [Sporosarcina aquimarina]|uniref:hypothetical protein n=1 Tax=Sporosarcina aquimarina TaxID=114975 RepID=UPI001C8D08A8|nr:hypothetical protein [Sporosarcina aquimarina]MBY0221593.1 hypothetical protein [Sporosarcina aquimarina]